MSRIQRIFPLRGDDWGYQVFVSLLIGFPWCTGQLFVLLPWLKRRSIPQQILSGDDADTGHWWLWVLVFNALVAMTYWNYYLACFTDPGVLTLPADGDESHSDAEDDPHDPNGDVGKFDGGVTGANSAEMRLLDATSARDQPAVRQSSRRGLMPMRETAAPETSALIVAVAGRGAVSQRSHHTHPKQLQQPHQQPAEVGTIPSSRRRCEKCQQPKPPRTHHCSTCQRCIRKMDHHCPWINNCVGYFNHGHFIRFLVYADTAIIMELFTLGRHAVALLNEYEQHRRIQLFRSGNGEPFSAGTFEVVMLVLNLLVLCIVLLFVGIMALYQLYYISTNTTTIESWERDRVAAYCRRKKIRQIQYPYDVGFGENIRAVLGRRWYLWLWPQKMCGDGLHFAVCRPRQISNEDASGGTGPVTGTATTLVEIVYSDAVAEATMRNGRYCDSDDDDDEETGHELV